MRRAFQPSADLRGITPHPIFVADVIHRSFVRVDEADAEAAAATAVPAVPFVADHPFLYLIRETGEDGRILFMGRMMGPAGGAGPAPEAAFPS